MEVEGDALLGQDDPDDVGKCADGKAVDGDVGHGRSPSDVDPVGGKPTGVRRQDLDERRTGMERSRLENRASAVGPNGRPSPTDLAVLRAGPAQSLAPGGTALSASPAWTGAPQHLRLRGRRRYLDRASRA